SGPLAHGGGIPGVGGPVGDLVSGAGLVTRPFGRDGVAGVADAAGWDDDPRHRFVGRRSGQKADRRWAATVTGMETWLLLLVMSLATYRGTKLVVEDTFPPVLWLRDKLAGGWREPTMKEQHHELYPQGEVEEGC